MTRTAACLAVAALFLLQSCGEDIPVLTCNVDGTSRPAQATAFTSNPAIAGVCGYAFDATTPGTVGVAVHPSIFQGTAGCGRCFQLTGPSGTLVVQAADVCASCTTARLFDLVDSSLQTLHGSTSGTATLRYREVTCPVAGNLRIQLDNVSNGFYLKARVLNHRNPVKAMELKFSGEFLPMERTLDNHFELTPGGAISAPYELRLTDVYGNVVVQSVTVTAGNTAEGTTQFPLCGGG